MPTGRPKNPTTRLLPGPRAPFAIGVATLLLTLALGLPAPASAVYVYDTKWGSVGTAEGQFNGPTGVATDTAGNVYVADRGNNRIQKFSSNGSFQRMWGWGVDDGTSAFQICTSSCQAGISGAGDGQFNEPNALATDAAGNVYVADAVNSRIQKFDSTGGFLGKWSGTDPPFNIPTGVATDTAGNVYVADRGNYLIQKFSSTGTFLTKWGGLSCAGGNFVNPSTLDTDAAGNLYVGEDDCYRIQKSNSTGTFERMWGWGVDDGASAFQICTSSCQAGISGAGDGQFYGYGSVPPFGPFGGVATDALGNVYAADRGNNRIQKFGSTGTFLGKWGSQGSGNGELLQPFEIDIDAAGNVYVADTGNDRIEKFADVPPDTTIDTGPSGLTNDNTPTFTVSSDQPGSSFECQIGGGGYSSCSSPDTLQTLADGAYTFEVRAVNTGTPDPTPASRAFTVDATPPQTQITSGPLGFTNDASPSFSFASDEPGSSFECNLDGQAWANCLSPKEYLSLPDGAHTLDVRATDQAGNRDSTPASRSFTVDTAAPDTTITSGPLGFTNDASPSFSFASDEPGSSFQCSIDGGAFATCSAPDLTASLPDGQHTFAVRAIDAAANTDASPATRSFTVDTAAPETTITNHAKKTVKTTKSKVKAKFEFTSSQPGPTFGCKLDGAREWEPCTSPEKVTVKRGKHTFSVRAADAASNVDPTPATFKWKVKKK